METHSLARLLKEHPVIKDLDDSQLEYLSGCAKNVRLAANQFLFREGDPANELYLIRSGKLALELHDGGRGTRIVETLGEGDAAGWSTLFPPYRWSMDGRAIATVQILSIDGACLRKKLDADHSFGYAFMRCLLKEVHQRLQRVRLQHLDVYGGSASP